MSNGKTYTEVLPDVYAKIDTVEQRVTGKLDAVIRDNSDFKAGLAKGDARLDAMNKRIDANVADINTNVANITKVRNLNATLTAVFSGIAALVGWNR